MAQANRSPTHLREREYGTETSCDSDLVLLHLSYLMIWLGTAIVDCWNWSLGAIFGCQVQIWLQNNSLLLFIIRCALNRASPCARPFLQNLNETCASAREGNLQTHTWAWAEKLKRSWKLEHLEIGKFCLRLDLHPSPPGPLNNPSLSSALDRLTIADPQNLLIYLETHKEFIFKITFFVGLT